MLQALYSQLASEVKQTYELEKDNFQIPILPQAQCIVIPVVRETIAPMLVRNNDADMVTDMRVDGKLRIRVIASKTKGVEKRRGSQILRVLGTGGWMAANKGFINKKADKKAGDIFDLNTFVFGDSANGSDKSIYPVHASVLYSDALSVQTLDQPLLDDVFRQGGISEEHVSFDAQSKKTSSNIFTTRAVLPGTLFVQTLVMNGKRMTPAAFNHLLLSLGLAGSYGGATATTGTNLKTRVAGIYWGKLERPINAPVEILRELGESPDADSTQLVAKLEGIFSQHYSGGAISAEVLGQYINSLMARFEDSDDSLTAEYKTAAGEVSGLFNAWFHGS
jgi:hypothetical protein